MPRNIGCEYLIELPHWWFLQISTNQVSLGIQYYVLKIPYNLSHLELRIHFIPTVSITSFDVTWNVNTKQVFEVHKSLFYLVWFFNLVFGLVYLWPNCLSSVNVLKFKSEQSTQFLFYHGSFHHFTLMV